MCKTTPFIRLILNVVFNNVQLNLWYKQLVFKMLKGSHVKNKLPKTRVLIIQPKKFLAPLDSIVLSIESFFHDRISQTYIIYFKSRKCHSSQKTQFRLTKGILTVLRIASSILTVTQFRFFKISFSDFFAFSEYFSFTKCHKQLNRTVASSVFKTTRVFWRDSVL